MPKKPKLQPKRKLPHALALLLIVFSTALVYGPSLDNEFLNWDDAEYITDNGNLTDASFHQHFLEHPEVMGNYHPLTMWSLAWSRSLTVDKRSGAINARMFHTTDLALHVLNALLVYLVILLLSGDRVVALITALLFAVHPMHVESVAWASARKDVLHAFFYLGALAAYVRYARAPQHWPWLIVTAGLFVLALLSKAVAVSLVPVLVLVDWYLGRRISLRSATEKLPFLFIAVWFGLKAIAAQEAFTSVQTDVYPLWQRLLFACYGLMMYTVKFIAPFGLSAFHGFPAPHEEVSIGYWAGVLFSLLFLITLWAFRRNRGLVFGVLFFVATVALVLQLMPVGGAVIAERYTYLPYIGLGFALAIGIVALWRGRARWRYAIVGAMITLLLIQGSLAYRRSMVWKDGITLWADAFEKDPLSPKVLNNYGVALNKAKRYDEAIGMLDRAVGRKPDYAEAWYNRGLGHYYMGEHQSAIADYSKAIEFQPGLAVAWHNRAGTWYTIGRPAEALSDALHAQELGYAVDPRFMEVLRAQSVTGPAQ